MTSSFGLIAWWSRLGTRFRTKLILVSTMSVLVGLILSGTVALWSIVRLRTDASARIEVGLTDVNREYLRNYIELTAQRTNFMIDRAFADMLMLTQTTQTIFDHQDEFAGIDEYTSRMPFFMDKLVYNPTGDWYQTGPDEPSVVSVFGHMLDADHKIRPDVADHIRKTILLDLVMPPIKDHGADKQWLYLVGPPGKSYLRLSPYNDMAAAFEGQYPGQNKQDFWAYYFPGLTDSWQKWVTEPDSKKLLNGEITFTPPYNDAAGSGIIVSLFHPLWSKDRKTIEGAIGLDFGLQQIFDFVEDVHLARTGFAFIANSTGNVIGLSKAREVVLGLKAEQTDASAGLSVFSRTLKDSSIPGFANLQLPTDDTVSFQDVDLANDERGYIVVTRRMRPINYFTQEGGIVPEQWAVYFVIPKQEIYASLYGAQEDLQRTARVILYGQIAIVIATLLLVSLALVRVSRTMTKGLTDLSASAAKIQKKNYDVQVAVETRDEIGQLGEVFNAMAREIQVYTQNLEGLVYERTQDLKKANEKITALNEQLREENLRMSAELNVARQLQTMVLPKEEDLEGISDLDISVYMEPTDEVGGDYYDVIKKDGMVKIGIGDVTGHGLESGVVVLMLQTAITTLLANNEKDPIRFYSVLNEVIYHNVQRLSSEKHVTLTLVDYQQGVCHLTGQHEEVIVVKAGGALERHDTAPLGLPLGLAPDIQDFTHQMEVPLATGDVVVLYTDGITEAEDPEGVQYGVDRLCDLVVKKRDLAAAEIKTAIIADVTAHIATQKVYDDITLVVIKKL